MASAKQIAWRKKFARMSKAGKFKKSKSWSEGKSGTPPTGKIHDVLYRSVKGKPHPKRTQTRNVIHISQLHKTKRTDKYVKEKLRELGFSTRTINKYLRERE